MSTDIERTAEVAQSAVLRALGLKQIGLPTSAVRAELIRAALWALSEQGSSPVYITRLLNAVERSMLPWTNVNAATENRLLDRTALDELELIGEVSVIPGGKWLPAPLRFVHLPALKRWLVLGAAPTAALPPHVQTHVKFAATARLLHTKPDLLGLPSRFITLEEWRQEPPEPIEQWAQNIIQKVQLQDYRHTDTLEIYAPKLARVSSQYYRWHRPNQQISGRYLARIRSQLGPTTHLIAEVRAGKIIAAGHISPREHDVRRLMYGIDAACSMPVSIFTTRDWQSVHFKLKSEVPTPEHRLLLALGRLQLDSNGTYYPRTWVVEADHADQVTTALQRLQVQIVDKETANHGPAARSARL